MKSDRNRLAVSLAPLLIAGLGDMCVLIPPVSNPLGQLIWLGAYRNCGGSILEPPYQSLAPDTTRPTNDWSMGRQKGMMHSDGTMPKVLLTTIGFLRCSHGDASLSLVIGVVERVEDDSTRKEDFI
ncbi:hypothetical protein RJT34_30416 [Clitoria ternatea]|uniref:Uncharacterized protein n=1 Tax=Clitoria ternatea TaxID=43366 RepID=A0AAN9EUH0_CLITE